MADKSSLTGAFRAAVAGAGVFRVVDRANIEKILAEQKFQQTGCTTEECQVQIGKMLNVEKIFTGTVGLLDEVYTLTADFINVGTSEIESSCEAEGKSLRELRADAKRLAGKFLAGAPAPGGPAVP